MLTESLTSQRPRAERPEKLVYASPSAALRVERAAEFLVALGSRAEAIVLGASIDAAAQVTRLAARSTGGAFGWHRFTVGRLAFAWAGEELGQRGLTPVGRLPLEAIAARIVHRLGARGLGRFGAIADRPGLPRALARTLDELRMAGLAAASVSDPALSTVLMAYEEELQRAALADRAEVLRLATLRARNWPLAELAASAVLLLDVPMQSVRERELVLAFAQRAPRLLATMPPGDERALEQLRGLPGVSIESVRAPASASGLARLQAGLFSPTAALGTMGDDVVLLSAPGESRECVEIARHIQGEADRGVPFDRMAVLLRSPLQYRAHLEEALRRAGVPAHYARGTVRPDPAGRAFLALLGCAADGLSARRFAEYLSLGEVADADLRGGPPAARPEGERWVPPDEDMLPEALVRASDEASMMDGAAREGSSGEASARALRTPRLWERLLVEAAVIGGIDRWEKRLAGLRRSFELDRQALRDSDEALALRLDRDIEAIDQLRDYALPLLSDLQAIAPPMRAPWGTWLDQLSALATRALRDPDRVLAVLAELAPMSDVGPVDLTEVRLVLEPRLTQLVEKPEERPFGRVYVAAVEEALGLVFDVVFVPGLAERLFPQKVTEDPILPDRERSKLSSSLMTNADRSARERFLLRVAVGAARQRLVVSYPRIDIEQSRPRTPSFYGLEVLRAAEGKLPGFDELARRAESFGGARLGWPAPARPAEAIDAAEHDLALLQSVLERPEGETVGMARYLLKANPHLERALRFRARRWIKAWTRADGLVDPHPLGRAALAAHALEARSYSPTALQNYAICPYKFVLQALHRLAPREEPAPLEELTPLQKGSLVHEVQFELLGALRDAGLVPVTSRTLPEARTMLDRVLDGVAERYRQDLAPAIARVWEDGIASIRADLREMLRRATEESSWVPAYFELSFGLTERRERDPRSQDEAAALSCGIKLRGSIDLIERRQDGSLRATDYKTGKARALDGTIVGGGQTLQPVLYALALEALFPGERVDSGRLYYCTSTGEFKDVVIPLDDEARQSAAFVAETIGAALREGFLPAAPMERACEYCDYKMVCGPYEEQRARKVKRQDKLVSLAQLRKRV